MVKRLVVKLLPGGGGGGSWRRLSTCERVLPEVASVSRRGVLLCIRASAGSRLSRSTPRVDRHSLIDAGTPTTRLRRPRQHSRQCPLFGQLIAENVDVGLDWSIRSIHRAGSSASHRAIFVLKSRLNLSSSPAPIPRIFKAGGGRVLITSLRPSRRRSLNLFAMFSESVHLNEH